MNFTPETDRVARRIGTVVILIFVLGLVATLLIKGIQWRQFNSWQAFGTFEDGLSGLKLGTPVRLGGVDMGTVTAIELDRSIRPRDVADGLTPLGPTTGGFIITFELDASIRLHTDARLVLDRNAISGSAELDILSIGGTRSAPIPGPLDEAAKRAPVLAAGRVLTIAARESAMERILGKKGAGDLDSIRRSVPGIRDIFMATEGPIDPATGEPWGPGRESRITRMLEALEPLAERLPKDFEAWSEQSKGISEQWQVLSRSLELDPDGGPDASPDAPRRLRPMVRIQQLESAFDDQVGLRAIWHQLSGRFSGSGSDWAQIRACLGPIGDGASLISVMWSALWPEIREDLLVTKTQFVIGSTELWLLKNVDVLISVVRAFQPFSADDEAALLLILSANRAAISADALTSAIQAATSSIADGSTLLDAATKRRLEEQVLPAVRRYRRDLSDLMTRLETSAAAASRR